ncbi:MAG: hydroxymethylglutaryl-CoA lyase [Flavobacteriales bacterium]|nr:hydroxymethylglutaryl-CoA lyase [Flavobacteriales bacterium]
MSSSIIIIECPRDAMQGIKEFIPTKNKIEYINQILKVGFDTIDFGSFVSPKAIPQLKDTAEVLEGLNLSSTSSKLLSIIANTRGANDACNFEEINYLGFPLSVSEQFQIRNTNKSIIESLNIVEEIQNLSVKNNKKLVVYLSMAFGNPYGENYHPNIVAELTEKLHQLDVGIVALSDTIGVSDSTNIAPLFSTLIKEYPTIEFGAHFHTTPDKWEEKVDSAYQNGCRRFDTAIKGFGGCPMAKDDLTGNMPTEKLITYFTEDLKLNKDEFEKSLELSNSIFA